VTPLRKASRVASRRVRIVGGPLDGQSVALADVLQEDGGLPEVVELGGANYYWFACDGEEIPEVVLGQGPEPSADCRTLRLLGPLHPPAEWKGWPL
jgi:hypothetical protein